MISMRVLLGLWSVLALWCRCRGEAAVRVCSPTGSREGIQILGPDSPSDWQDWLTKNKASRQEQLESIHYNGSIFNVPALKWTRNSLIQPQMHPYDLYFYNRKTHQYTVDKYLDDLQQRYGGIDSLLLWPTFTNLGVDDRNQFDMFRTAPGGIAGLKGAIEELHARGVRVLVAYNPWDTGTRREPVDDAHALTQLIADLGADGFNGDTMSDVPEEFYEVSVEIHHPVAIEPEHGGSLESMGWDTMGWGYWAYPWQPCVDHWKWLETRRMTNVCDRFNKNKTDNLQAAWFNGVGYETWENIWGTWNGVTPRDGEAIRRMSAMARFFNREMPFLLSPNWTPYYPALQNDWVFTSMWPMGNETLWTLVNRASLDSIGRQLEVDDKEGLHFYDCYHGMEVIPSVVEGKATLSFDIEMLGFGCLLSTFSVVRRGDGTKLGDFLSLMFGMTDRPLKDYNETWTCLPQYVTPVIPTERYNRTPAGMIKIPKADRYHFNVTGVEWGGLAVDFAYPWEYPKGAVGGCPNRTHDSYIFIEAFYIDKYPVTNADYRDYLDQSGYVPRDPTNFLRFWTNGSYPVGWDKKPVTWVCLEEARAYCSFVGRRLPHEWEWMYAAQGTDRRLLPWGNDDTCPDCMPMYQHGQKMPGPDDVDAHPKGDSPFGVSDLVGNIWQWTDEFQDAHTRAAVLRGQSNYRPDGAQWYFPTSLLLTQHNKYLLWDESYDRSGAIGFRCAADSSP